MSYTPITGRTIKDWIPDMPYYERQIVFCDKFYQVIIDHISSVSDLNENGELNPIKYKQITQ